MPSVRTYLHAFNVGVHDTTALARIDLERMRLAAEQQTNILPLATGAGLFRPGLEFLAPIPGACRMKEFVFGATDAALLQFTDQALRVHVDDELVTRSVVTAAITSGDFASSTGWTLAATGGAAATISGGYLNLTALARGSIATCSQQVTVNEIGTEHTLVIVVDRGPVTFRCGSFSGGDDHIAETALGAGTHSLAFVPSTASFYIEFSTRQRNLKRVDNIYVASGSSMVLPTPWATAALGSMRFSQSADVVFVAAAGYPPYRIERRSAQSWSIVRYQPDDGPFTIDRTRQIKLKCSVTEGNGTLTAEEPFFTAAMAQDGVLFRLFNEGQKRSVQLAAGQTFTEPLRVTGINEEYSRDRDWSYTVSGDWDASGAPEMWVQRSFDDPDAGYNKFRKNSTAAGAPSAITADVTDANMRDNDDNAIAYYRIGFVDTGYVSGVATVSYDYDGGGGYGICRVVGYTSPTQVDVEVLKPFSNTTYTNRWQQGEWSSDRVWPSAVALSDGRLFWSGADRIWGSASDAFDVFDEEMEGDAAPISRSIATGGVNDTQWMLPLQRLLIGTDGAVAVAKSSSLDEPLTPANMSIRDASTTGCAGVEAVKVDSRGLFIERAGRAVMEVLFDGSSGDYVATQLSKLTTTLFGSGVKEIAIQRRPDTRIWIVTRDGGCVCVLYEPGQEVLAFVPIETDGAFESVAVLPSTVQDRVYFSVIRSVGGIFVRHLEKMARDDEAAPAPICKIMDAFVTGSAPSGTTTLSGATHLVGKSVVVWADGEPIESSPGVPMQFTVDGSGQIGPLPYAVNNWIAGLPYRGRYKSARLAYGASGGTALLVRKTINDIGLLMANFCRFGVKYGAGFDTMYPLPGKVDGSTKPAVVSGVMQDEHPVPFGGQWSTDSRICLEVNSPYCAAFLGMTFTVQTNG